MRRAFLTSIILLGLSGPLFALGGTSGNFSTCSDGGIFPTDANGWSIFPAPTTGTTYYVSDSLGNDSWDGTAPIRVGVTTVGPKKTIDGVSGGNTLLTADTGKDSHLLLRKGDFFNEQLINPVGQGVDCQHPWIIGSYDENQLGVVDPYISATIASIACTGTTATITTSATHAFNKGASVSINIEINRELPAGFNGQFVGAATFGTSTITFTVGSCPAASDTAHGVVTTRRPTIQVSGNNYCGPKDGGNPGNGFLAVVGIECYGWKNDPNNAAFDRSSLALTNSLGCGFVNTLATIVWRFYEDNKVSYCQNGGITTQPASNRGATGWVIMRRNVLDHNFDYGGGGFYVAGANHYWATENNFLYGGWAVDLIGPNAVTVTTGTPGVINWPAHPFINDGRVMFTAAAAPTGLTLAAAPQGTPCPSDGSCYFVHVIGANSFSLSTTAGNANPVNLSTAGTSVVAYWATPFQPGIVTAHSFYLQNGMSTDTGVWDIQLTGNISGFQAADWCECGSNATIVGNVGYQSAANGIGMGKSGQFYLGGARPYRVSYNGVFEASYFYQTPYYFITTAFLLNCCGTGGLLGTVDHNLVLYGMPDAKTDGSAVGIIPQDNEAKFPGTAIAWNNNIVCGLNAAFTNRLGEPYQNGLAVSTPGSGYATNTGSGTYSGPDLYGIPLIGGHGNGANVSITVNGTTGQVTAANSVYQGFGIGYQVGDVLTTADNSQIGGAGSGWTYIVDTLGGFGSIGSGHVNNGGSGYLAPYSVAGTTVTGTGSNAFFLVTVSGGVVTKVYTIYGSGAGYAPGDLVGLTVGGASNARATIGSVVGPDTFSNNTLKLTDCNNLQSATSPVNGIPSVAPQLTPTATPTTDVIGGYWQTLAYAYQKTIPTSLTLSGTVGHNANQTTTWEVGFTDALRNQQKGNWDSNLTATALLNWARPQFGMANP